ncbi:hypothetical protein HNR65_001198 [Desulfosalsimonas propionicica]|uniref:DUF2905 domain-containing protein n=1 Tax=Desulfosalsimonas propionicica TaxID=332175 RepID=A0A7W0HK53_9BACT|nr:DUF2905 family protein [Desulfosalsimonas propionicica]MBA2880880.1 hypothetical protein [Desulfosalsimonas propionicica]
MNKTLIAIGIVIAVIGVFWPWIVRLPVGRLPGDIIIDRPGLKVYIPVTTMIVISVVISVVFWILRK